MTPNVFPDGERKHISHIEFELSNLEKYVRDFGAAVSLFNYCSQFGFEFTDSWQFVAARDGGMSVYHTAKVMEGIRASFGLCPIYREKIDHTKLRDAVKQLEVSFPGYIKLRHAIAHSAELSKNRDEAEKNSTKGPLLDFGIEMDESSSIFMNNGLSGNRFFTSIDGIMAWYEISNTKLNELNSIRDTFKSGFSNVLQSPFERSWNADPAREV